MKKPPTEDLQTPLQLPESRLALRLVPYLQKISEGIDDDGGLIVNYAGHLDPLAAGATLADLPGVPEAAVPGEALPPLGVVVTVQPQVWADADGNRQMTFSVNAQLPREMEPGPVEASESASLSPWRHDVSSPEVKEAATKVLSARVDDRRAALLKLIDVMVTPIISADAEV